MTNSSKLDALVREREALGYPPMTEDETREYARQLAVLNTPREAPIKLQDSGRLDG